jgi:hypothetical protein
VFIEDLGNVVHRLGILDVCVFTKNKTAATVGQKISLHCKQFGFFILNSNKNISDLNILLFNCFSS